MPVVARFHEIRDRVIASVDKVFAEPVLIFFLKDSKTDPTRSSNQIEAVLRTEDELISPLTGGKDKTWSTEIASQNAQLNIDRALYPDLVITKGDKVRAVSRPNEPWFVVLHVDDRSHSRLIIYLGASK